MGMAMICPSSEARMRLALAPMFLLLLLAAPALARDSAIQITHQGPTTVLVQKDVGSDRWAINVSLEETSALEVTGNVFRPNGSAAFLQCRPIDVLNPDAPLAQRVVVYNCYGSDSCPGAPCSADQWSFLTTVNLPVTFLLP
jgi:hypothetical protein